MPLKHTVLCRPHTLPACRIPCARYRLRKTADDQPVKDFNKQEMRRCVMRLDAALYPAKMLRNYLDVDQELNQEDQT